jgi:hypothetical protein|tara:strand:- start:2758 stop:2892 length:135 start_codon:yes stop_codon:yes gene_type:complete
VAPLIEFIVPELENDLNEYTETPAPKNPDMYVDGDTGFFFLFFF